MTARDRVSEVEAIGMLFRRSRLVFGWRREHECYPPYVDCDCIPIYVRNVPTEEAAEEKGLAWAYTGSCYRKTRA